MEQSLVQDRLKFWYDQGIHMICCDLWVCCFMCLCNTISYQESMAGMVVMDVDKAECFVYRSFMRTWLARRICESAGIAWIAFVFQVFSWTGGENAGTTETAQEGKSEYELELYGGAEDSSGACVSRPLSSQVSLCILCEFMTRNFQDHLPVRVVEPLIKARKDLREKGEKAEETTCQWSGFGTFDLHFMIGHGTEPGAGQTEILIWSRNTHDMLWFVSLLLHVSLQHDFLSGKHGRHGRDGRGQGWVFCRSFMRTWLARRICESAGIAWIAFVFQVFSWTGGENAGTTETAQEGKSEYELELYGGAEDSSGACVSRPVSSQVNLCILCQLMTKNFQDHLPVRVVEPLIKARKDLREKGEKAEETTCQWSGFGTFDLHFMIGHGKEPGAGQTEFLIWSRNTHDTWWFVSSLVSRVFATRFPIRKAWPAWSWWTWTRLNAL